MLLYNEQNEKERFTESNIFSAILLIVSILSGIGLYIIYKCINFDIINYLFPNNQMTMEHNRHRSSQTILQSSPNRLSIMKQSPIPTRQASIKFFQFKSKDNCKPLSYPKYKTGFIRIPSPTIKSYST